MAVQSGSEAVEQGQPRSRREANPPLHLSRVDVEEVGEGEAACCFFYGVALGHR